MTGRTIRQFEVMKSSCCFTGAGVMAPKGTSRSLGTLMDILLSFSLDPLKMKIFSTPPEIFTAGFAEFLEFDFLEPALQRGHVFYDLGQALLFHHPRDPGHGAEDGSGDPRTDSRRVHAAFGTGKVHGADPGDAVGI